MNNDEIMTAVLKMDESKLDLDKVMDYYILHIYMLLVRVWHSSACTHHHCEFVVRCVLQCVLGITCCIAMTLVVFSIVTCYYSVYCAAAIDLSVQNIIM
jgi:hypothetical protein